jgi:hypothetical protein
MHLPEVTVEEILRIKIDESTTDEKSTRLLEFSMMLFFQFAYLHLLRLAFATQSSLQRALSNADMQHRSTRPEF